MNDVSFANIFMSVGRESFHIPLSKSQAFGLKQLSRSHYVRKETNLIFHS